MNKENLVNELNSVYVEMVELGKSVLEAHAKAEHSAYLHKQQKRKVEGIFGDALISNQLTGKNEATRNAEARTLFAADYMRLEELEKHTLLDGNVLSQVSLHYSQVKDRYYVLNALVQLLGD